MGKQVTKKGAKGSRVAIKGTRKRAAVFRLDCSMPIADNVIVLSDFQQYMQQRIKVEGKVGNLGNPGMEVEVSKDGDKLVVTSKIDMSKRYLKYLTKKYLKK